MGSDGTHRIPVVDLSGVNLKPGTHAWAAARAQIFAALEFYGCFEAAYDGVTPELWEAAFGVTKELFALPLETKKRNALDKFYSGYQGEIPDVPYESMAVVDVLDPAKARGFTHLMWPHGNPTFYETALSFSEKVAELERMVRRMVLETLGVDKHCDSYMESTRYVLRVSEYAPEARPDEEERAKIILTPHVDSDVSTLIYQDRDGLEVQARSGDWVPFTPSSPNAVIFLVGNAFRAWSNDRLFAPPHRVRGRAGKTRYTVMLLAMPKDEAVVEAPAELVEEGRPPRFRPYRYHDYMQFLVASQKELGMDMDWTTLLTNFCGTGGEQRVQA